MYKLYIYNTYVTGFAKRGLPHTSNLPTLTIDNFRLERAIYCLEIWAVVISLQLNSPHDGFLVAELSTRQFLLADLSTGRFVCN